MTKRILFRVPEDTVIDGLTEQQRAAIHALHGQFVVMPNTIPHEGHKIIDAICDDAFDVSLLFALGLAWQLVGVWTDAGQTLLPISADVFIDHLPQPVDENGNPSGEKVLHEPHRWSGWGICF